MCQANAVGNYTSATIKDVRHVLDFMCLEKANLIGDKVERIKLRVTEWSFVMLDGMTGFQFTAESGIDILDGSRQRQLGMTPTAFGRKKTHERTFKK